MEISAIIPFHSNHVYLELCLMSLRDTSELLSEVILTTHSTQALKSAESWSAIRPLVLDKPSLYSSAMNRAAKAARSELLLFCDADTFFPNYDWISAHLQIFTKTEYVGATSSKLIDTNTGRIADFGIGRTRFNHFHPFRDTHPDHPRTRADRRVQLTCSAVMMVPRDLFLHMGGFDENLIYHYQDVDFCARLNRQGYDVWVAAKALAYHRGSSAAVTRRPFKPDEYAYYTAKNSSHLVVDFPDYLGQSLDLHSDQIGGSSFALVDLSTVPDLSEITSVLGRYADFEILSRSPACDRDASSVSLLDKLDHKCHASDKPLLVVVDRHTSVQHSSLWTTVRDTSRDLVIDRHANVAPFNEVVHGSS